MCAGCFDEHSDGCDCGVCVAQRRVQWMKDHGGEEPLMDDGDTW